MLPLLWMNVSKRLPTEISLRRIIEIAVLLAVIAPFTRFLSEETTLGAAARVVFPCLALAVLPGLAVVCSVGFLRRQSFTGLLAFSVALSLPVVQAATLTGLLGHFPVSRVAEVFCAATVLALVVARIRTDRSQTIRTPPEDWLVLACIVPFAVLLYVKGTPFFADEFQTHIAVIRRLAFLSAPSSAEIFPIAGVPYTHPFPSVHVLMAMTSTLGEIDPLFVFHKTRFFWGPASLLLLFTFAGRLFDDRRLATASFLGSLGFTLAGPFADYPQLFWAQLAGYSHPSDVAIGICLPAAMLLFLAFLDADTRREAIQAFLLTILSITALTLTHIREAVQFAVYTSAFGVAMLVLPLRRRACAKGFLTAFATMVICKVYASIHAELIPSVSHYNDPIRAELLDLLARSSVWDLFAAPQYPYWSISLCLSVFPLILFASPLLVGVLGRNYKIWFVGASILAYILLIRFPLFSILYTYFTFWEILSTSIRNVSFFCYALAGPMLYLLLTSLQRYSTAGRLLSMSGILAILFGAIRVSPLLQRWENGGQFYVQAFFIAIVCGYIVAAYCIFPSGGDRWSSVREWLRLRIATSENSRRLPAGIAGATGFLLLLAALCFSVYDQTTSPLAVHAVSTIAPSDEIPIFLTPRDVSERSPVWRSPECKISGYNVAVSKYKSVVEDVASEAPPLRLMQWAAESIPSDGRLAVNTYALYSPSTFFPQAVAALPLVQTGNFYYLADLMPAYLQQFERCISRHGVQPFFNAVESETERREFLQQLGVTHVVIDPAIYDQMTPLPEACRELLAPAYDDGRWAVYRVVGEHLEPGTNRVADRTDTQKR